MDFVHDTLADGRPFRTLTVVDNWSRSSPVLEAGSRMSGDMVSQVLDRVVGDECLNMHQFASLAEAQATSKPGEWITITTARTAYSGT